MVSGGGCDERGEPATVAVSQTANALSDEAEGTTFDTTDVVNKVTANDGAVLPITMQWLSFSKGEVSESSDLSMEIGNISENDFTLTVNIVASGLMSMTRTAKVGEWKLPAKETVVAAIPASDIPLQVTAGAAQARMEIVLSMQSPAAGEEESLRYFSSVVSYRHDANYERLSIFDEETLMNQFQGILFEMPSGALESPVTLGRVIDEKGNIREVKSTDEEFVVTTENGAVAGYETGAFVNAVEVIDIKEVTE